MTLVDRSSNSRLQDYLENWTDRISEAAENSQVRFEYGGPNAPGEIGILAPDLDWDELGYYGALSTVKLWGLNYPSDQDFDAVTGLYFAERSRQGIVVTTELVENYQPAEATDGELQRVGDRIYVYCDNESAY